MSDQEQRDLGGELAADHDAARPRRALDEAELLAIIRQLVRVKGGGSVQKAFGRPQMGGGWMLDGGAAEVTVRGGLTLQPPGVQFG